MKRAGAIVSTLALAAVILIVVLSRARHTEFGEIKRARLTEPHSPTLAETIVSSARKIFHLSAVDTRQRVFPRIGNAQIEWSLMSTAKKTGWLSFAKPESNDPLWEFGPCSRFDLREVLLRDLQVEFVRKGDTNGIRSLFDADSWLETALGQTLENGRAIPVKEGQVILARLIESPNTIYAIRLADQRGNADWGSITVEHVAIDTKQARP